MNFTIFLFIFR